MSNEFASRLYHALKANTKNSRPTRKVALERVAPENGHRDTQKAKMAAQALQAASREFSQDFAEIYRAFKARKKAISEGKFDDNTAPDLPPGTIPIKHVVSTSSPELAAAINKQLQAFRVQKMQEANLEAKAEFTLLVRQITSRYKAKKKAISEGKFGNSHAADLPPGTIPIKHVVSTSSPELAAAINKHLRVSRLQKLREDTLEARAEFTRKVKQLTSRYTARRKAIDNGSFGEKPGQDLPAGTTRIKHFRSNSSPELAAQLNRHLKTENAEKARQARVDAFHDYSQEFAKIHAGYKAKKKAIAERNV